MALEKGAAAPVLKWVRQKDEDETKEQFQKTLIARMQGKEAKDLACRSFFPSSIHEIPLQQ